MEKYIPVNKMTKKQQKNYYAKHRTTWGELNPVTRVVPNGKGKKKKTETGIASM